MIHYFSVSNFQSIREETILDLRIPKTAPSLPRFRPSKAKPDIRLPSVVVLMGPNGSGKTTLLRALIAVIRIITIPLGADHKPLETLIPFFSKAARDEPTRFCVEFEADWLAPVGTMDLFRYELDAYSGRIAHEALLHFPRGRRRRLFERGLPGEAIHVSGEFGITSKDDRLKAVREDASVIATLAMLNVPLAKKIVENMEPVLLATNIVYQENWLPQFKVVADLLEKNPDMKQWLKREMQRGDLGIHDMTIEDANGNGKHVFFSHHGLDEPVHWLFESNGTKRQFRLFPQIRIALDHAIPIIIDEIDGDLHVDIVRDILHKFQSREINPHDAQLFVTSHNVGLLDDLEKEELFIVEKGGDGGTRVHGVQDVQGLRRDTRLYAKYRHGVLGGLPKIG